MNAGLPHDNPPEIRAEETDPVWHLLGQVPPAQPDAWFTVRTVARCRHAVLETEPRGWTLTHLWRWALGTGLGIGLAVFAMTPRVNIATDPAADTNQKSVQEAFEIMASMGSDSDSSSSTSTSSPEWTDSSL